MVEVASSLGVVMVQEHNHRISSQTSGIEGMLASFRRTLRAESILQSVPAGTFSVSDSTLQVMHPKVIKVNAILHGYM